MKSSQSLDSKRRKKGYLNETLKRVTYAFILFLCLCCSREAEQRRGDEGKRVCVPEGEKGKEEGKRPAPLFCFALLCSFRTIRRLGGEKREGSEKTETIRP